MHGQAGSHQWWGRAGQLGYLRAGRHPKTREPLPPAIDEDGRCFAYQRGMRLDSARLEGRSSVNATTASAYPTAASSIYAGDTSASDKMKARLERIRAEKVDARPTVRRLRGKQPPGIEWLT